MNRYLNRGSNLILLLLGMLSLCLIVQESFGLVLPPETYFWLSLLCVLLWVATTFRYGLLIGMPLSAALLFYLYQEKSADLASEMRDLFNRISDAYYGHYTAGSAAFSADGFTGSHEVAILFIFFILTAFVAVSLHSAGFRVSLILLATAPVFAVCIAINGTPSTWPVVGLLLFWTGTQLGGDTFRMNDGAGKLLLFGLIPCILVFSALLLLYNPETYTPSEYDISLSQRFDKLGNMLAEMLSESEDAEQSGSANMPTQTVTPMYRAPKGWDQNSSDLDLTAEFDSSQLYKEAFQLSSDSVGSLYMRGRSYGDYEGTSWTSAVENTHGNALNYVGYAVAGRDETVLYSFQVQSPVPYDVLYLPYYSISESANDVCYPSGGYSSYSGSFYLTSLGADRLQASVSLPSQLQTDEAQYREYVHTYYTRLPDSTKTALLNICQQQGFSSGQENVVWSVADYVRRQGTYDISVEPYPSDDYAVWFLTESHRGYCIHFATSAVAIYRALGIPARVCEGYLVNNTEAGRAVQVYGSDAHAWAEVYLDGLGWIPVEVTASAAADSEQPAQGSTAPTPEPSGGDDSADETPQNRNEDDPEEKEGGDGAARDSGREQDGSGRTQSGGGISRFWKGFFAALAVAAAAAALFAGHYLLVRNLLRRRLSDPDGNRRAVSYYRQATRVVRYGGEIPRILQETAEKACFSQHIISGAELSCCDEALQNLTAEVSSGLSKWKRFCFRYLSGNQ